MVAELHPVERYFSVPYWHGVAERSRLYRPVTVLSFALRHEVVGDDARVAHAINLLLHGLATLLAYALVRGLGAGPRLAGVAALCFGVHAIHSEVIAAVSGRAELLAFCALGRDDFADANSAELAQAQEARIAAATEEASEFDAGIVMLTLHAGVAHPEIAESVEIESD